MACPACGAEFTLDVLIAHDGAREALVEAMGLNLSLGKRLVQYLSLFRPAKRQLTMDRVASLLKEVSPSIKAARITRNGRDWVIPQESWAWALEEIVAKKDKLTLPLKSHGYLFEMLIAAADKLEGRAEAASENQRRGATPVGAVSNAGPALVVRPVALVPPPPRTDAPQAFKDVLAKMKLQGGPNA
ncbi:hypothetical protein BA896_021895 [Janthinobacterium lividum]|uniref:Uncharacterized protein n=1 Tax=Janthinobacterium lividum TaxID=29581 RepID=A0A1E8PLA3_9BURK|nr:hypothetical protein BA896_021895 [Janthinobacterium lividum]